MAMPVKPSDFDAVIPAPDASMATLLLLFIRLSILLYKIHQYKWDASGNITPAFAADICSLTCSSTTTTTT